MMPIIVGVIGTFLLIYSVGNTTTRAEVSLIKHINELPSDSIVLTSQVNDSLITVYGDKEALTVDLPDLQQDSDLNAVLLAKTNQAMQDQIFGLYENSKIIETIALSMNGSTIKEEKKSILLDDNNINNYPVSNTLKQKINTLKDYKNRPMYFVYSFAKFKGFLRNGQAWKSLYDHQNLGYFETLNNISTIYKDNNGILIKINN